jgi:hypothetical protein
MPRGVYARKGKKKPATARKVASVPLSGVGALAVKAAPAAPTKAVLPLKAPGQEPKAINAKTHEQLRAYAATLGIPKRDIQNLTLSRLQQNCMVRVTEMMED